MKWNLTEIIGRYQAHTGKRITYHELYDQTGVSPSILSGLAQGKTQRLDLSTMQRLLDFFSDALGEPLTSNDLLEYRR